MEVSCHFKELNMRNLEMRVTGNRLCIRYMIALQRTSWDQVVDLHCRVVVQFDSNAVSGLGITSRIIRCINDVAEWSTRRMGRDCRLVGLIYASPPPEVATTYSSLMGRIELDTPGRYKLG